MALVRFSDADVAAGAQRGELTLVGRICGAPPALHSLKATMGRLWNCVGEFSMVPLGWGLIQIVFSSLADAKRTVKEAPWILPKFLLHLTKWASPSQELADSLTCVPLMLQLWGIPFECLTERLGSLLGASLGPADPATIHQSESSGGLFIQVRVTLDLTKPLPDEIPAEHEDGGKGVFKVMVKYTKLPQFCYLCGIIGHIGQSCPQKAELEGKPPRYGRHTVSQEKGPRVSELALTRRKKRFSWARQMITADPGTGLWGVSSPKSGALVVNSRMKALSIERRPDAEPRFIPKSMAQFQQIGEDSREEGEIMISEEPAPKRVCTGKALVVTMATSTTRVEETSPDWSQLDK
ncbi:unnamed protein product [Linum trigynum]